MHLEFPRLLYRPGKQWQLESGWFDLRKVANQAECDQALADGWHLDQYGARNEEIQEQGRDAAEEVLTKRQQLEAEAASLGVKVDKRWGDAKLQAAIEEARKATEAQADEGGAWHP
jgi:hypothetical protein